MENLEGIDEAYTTTDFEFVAFALCNGRPRIRISALIPMEMPERQNPKYIFALLGAPDQSGVIEEGWRDALRKLNLAYINGETRAEPTSLATKRKFLRGLVKDTEQRKNKGVRVLEVRVPKGQPNR